MLRRALFVRTDVPEERIASIIRAPRIGELETTLAVTSNRIVTANVLTSPFLGTLIMEAIRSSERSVLTRTTQRNVPEDGIL
jgi:hypothetical protein